MSVFEKRKLSKASQSASYCCEASGSVEAAKLPKENAFQKHELSKASQSASYCCEASEVIEAKKLPKEDAYKL